MDYQGTKIYGANMQERRKAQTQETDFAATFFLNATAVFSCAWEAEMLDKAFSKVAQLGGKVGVHDLPRTVSLANTSFFWLESWRNLSLE